MRQVIDLVRRDVLMESVRWCKAPSTLLSTTLRGEELERIVDGT
jgi:hypothetical protein